MAEKLSPAAVAGIRELHRDDPVLYSKTYLAVLYGVSGEMIRRVLDPEMWALMLSKNSAKRSARRDYRRERQAMRESVGDRLRAELPAISRPISDHDLVRIRRAMPKDTRDLTGWFCGDPLPGRSALDQRQGRGT